MRQFCQDAIHVLATTTGKKWAEEYVRLRMEFHRKHGHGLILSIWHGIDFFDNVYRAITQDEKFKEPEGEYKRNFLKLIEIGKGEA